MQTLKPCPLCGGEAAQKSVHDKFSRGWVGCPRCKLYIQWQVSGKEAIAKWNMRTPGA